MTEFGWALVNIGVVIGLIILVFIFFDIVCVFTFNTIFRKHNKAMAVCLNVKFDNILSLYDLMKNSEIQMNESVATAVCSIQRNDLNDPASEACKKAQANLTYIRDELLYIARSYPELNDNPDFVLARDNVKQLDSQYRNAVAMYNADCLGYNYWISFWPTRWIWKMLKFKKRDLLAL